MKTTVLKLETLHLVPGLAKDFDLQISSLVADCKSRPGIGKKRRPNSIPSGAVARRAANCNSISRTSSWTRSKEP